MRVKNTLIWLKEFQFGENKLANFGESFFNLAKILAKASKTLAQALSCYISSKVMTEGITYAVVETKFGMHSSFGRVVGHLHLSEPEFYSSEKKITNTCLQLPSKA